MTDYQFSKYVADLRRDAAGSRIDALENELWQAQLRQAEADPDDAERIQTEIDGRVAVLLKLLALFETSDTQAKSGTESTVVLADPTPVEVPVRVDTSPAPVQVQPGPVQAGP